jgi:hypothetical protein
VSPAPRSASAVPRARASADRDRPRLRGLNLFESSLMYKSKCRFVGNTACGSPKRRWRTPQVVPGARERARGVGLSVLLHHGTRAKHTWIGLGHCGLRAFRRAMTSILTLGARQGSQMRANTRQRRPKTSTHAARKQGEHTQASRPRQQTRARAVDREGGSASVGCTSTRSTRHTALSAAYTQSNTGKHSPLPPVFCSP